MVLVKTQLSFVTSLHTLFLVTGRMKRRQVGSPQGRATKALVAAEYSPIRSTMSFPTQMVPQVRSHHRAADRSNPIQVHFGYSVPGPGVYLQVSDTRIAEHVRALDDENTVAHSDGRNGTGLYFSLYTGQLGVGTKVSSKTMVTYLKRFRVSGEDISALPLLVPRDAAPAGVRNACAVCRAPSSQRCFQCQEEHYCSDKCQTQNYAIHQIFCSMKVPSTASMHLDPPKVKALLFPENGKPLFVLLPLILTGGDRNQSDSCNVDMRGITNEFHFGSCLRRELYKSRNFHVVHKVNFLHDPTTKANQCIHRIVQAKFPRINTPYWRGNVMILKRGRRRKFADLSKSDLSEVVDLLIKHTLVGLDCAAAGVDSSAANHHGRTNQHTV